MQKFLCLLIKKGVIFKVRPTWRLCLAFVDQLGFLWSTDTEDCESQWYMMPIRMRGNCRLHRHHDKLPPPQWGLSCETRFHEVMLSLRVLSAIDLDCSLPLGHGKGWHKTKARDINAHKSDEEAVWGSTLRFCDLVIRRTANIFGRMIKLVITIMLISPPHTGRHIYTLTRCVSGLLEEPSVPGESSMGR